jgi:hypothetical protein
MRRAYRKRDVETLLWSFLKLTEEEIKKGIAPKSRTFNGRDINGFVQNLVQLERIRKGTGIEDEAADDDGLSSFSAPREHLKLLDEALEEIGEE